MDKNRVKIYDSTVGKLVQAEKSIGLAEFMSEEKNLPPLEFAFDHEFARDRRVHSPGPAEKRRSTGDTSAHSSTSVHESPELFEISDSD